MWGVSSQVLKTLDTQLLLGTGSLPASRVQHPVAERLVR